MARQRREPNTGLVPLKYGQPYCETCGEQQQTGWLVYWGQVRTRDGGLRKTVFCARCRRGQLRTEGGTR